MQIVADAGKFKFCLLELSVFFFFSIIFDPQVIESMHVEPVDMEG